MFQEKSLSIKTNYKHNSHEQRSNKRCKLIIRTAFPCTRSTEKRLPLTTEKSFNLLIHVCLTFTGWIRTVYIKMTDKGSLLTLKIVACWKILFTQIFPFGFLFWAFNSISRPSVIEAFSLVVKMKMGISKLTIYLSIKMINLLKTKYELTLKHFSIIAYTYSVCCCVK